MPRTARITLRVLLLTALLLGVFAGAALAGPPDPLTQLSLTVQEDQCEGYAILWMSYDEGETWHPFVQTAIHGDPTNCPAISYEEPSYTQSSLEWTPEVSNARGPYAKAPSAGVAGPWGETQQVTLDDAHGATTGTLVTTVSPARHKAESYYAQATLPSRFAQVGVIYGTKPGTFQKEP